MRSGMASIRPQIAGHPNSRLNRSFYPTTQIKKHTLVSHLDFFLLRTGQHNPLFFVVFCIPTAGSSNVSVVLDEASCTDRLGHLRRISANANLNTAYKRSSVTAKFSGRFTARGPPYEYGIARAPNSQHKGLSLQVAL